MLMRADGTCPIMPGRFLAYMEANLRRFSTMKVELKRVKIANNMSQETVAFTADLWVNSAKIADLRNDGRGGPNHIMPIMVKNESTIDRLMEFVKWCEAQPPYKDGGYGDITMTADFYIALMLEKYQEAQQLKRWCKTKTVVRLEGDEKGDYHTYRQGYSPEFARHIRQVEGNRLLEIVNERYI